ncbi:MAG: hypothetical protein R3F35_15255 [Myxococcota bacterium]
MLLAWAAAILIASSSAGRATAADLEVIGGELVGASNVVVGGVAYDVSFVEGSCNSLFGAPDCQAIPYPFRNLPSAELAGLALLDQVFIDGPAGNFDTAPNLIAGCSSTTVCAAATAFGSDPPSNVLEVSAVNVSPSVPGGDLVQNFSVSQTLDTTSIPDAVYVDWTLSALPPGPVLNEISVNPPGADMPYEYLEIRGEAGGTLANVYAVAFDGDVGFAGIADWVVNLSAFQLGANGILMVKSASGHPAAAGTTVVVDPQFDTLFGFENGTMTLMLIRTATGLVEGVDYDVDDNGALELPADALVIDSVGWDDGNQPDDHAYGPTLLLLPPAVGAATRLIDMPTPFLASAWFHGVLAGTQNDGVLYDPALVSPNAPNNAALTPGAPNQSVAQTPSLAPAALALLVLGLLIVASVKGALERRTRRVRRV